MFIASVGDEKCNCLIGPWKVKFLCLVRGSRNLYHWVRVLGLRLKKVLWLLLQTISENPF